jgi:hypothetical protein
MGKAIGGLPEAAPLEPEPAAEAGFALGSWLARQRELRGISREELSALTRLPLRSLERLEAGAFDGQRDGFVRGFVRTVAVAIGLDADDAVARLLAEPAARARRRALDPWRVAAAAAGLLALLAAGAAWLEWQKTPATAGEAAEPAPMLRPDPVRALAAEHGLLDLEPGADPYDVALDPEPLGTEEAPDPVPAPDAPAAAAPGVAAPASE